MNISDSMIDQLAALDQAESQFRSENIKFGIRHRMKSGKFITCKAPFGYHLKMGCWKYMSRRQRSSA